MSTRSIHENISSIKSSRKLVYLGENETFPSLETFLPLNVHFIWKKKWIIPKRAAQLLIFLKNSNEMWKCSPYFRQLVANTAKCIWIRTMRPVNDVNNEIKSTTWCGWHWYSCQHTFVRVRLLRLVQYDCDGTARALKSKNKWNKVIKRAMYHCNWTKREQNDIDMWKLVG